LSPPWGCLGLALLRAVICCGVATVTRLLFGLKPVGPAVPVLRITAPAAVTSCKLAAKSGVDAEAEAGLVVACTLISVATPALALVFLI